MKVDLKADILKRIFAQPASGKANEILHVYLLKKEKKIQTQK